MAPVRLMDWLGITTSLDVKSSVAKDPPHVRGDGNRSGHSIWLGFNKHHPVWQKTGRQCEPK